RSEPARQVRAHASLRGARPWGLEQPAQPPPRVLRFRLAEPRGDAPRVKPNAPTTSSPATADLTAIAERKMPELAGQPPGALNGATADHEGAADANLDHEMQQRAGRRAATCRGDGRHRRVVARDHGKPAADHGK